MLEQQAEMNLKLKPDSAEFEQAVKKSIELIEKAEAATRAREEAEKRLGITARREAEQVNRLLEQQARETERFQQRQQAMMPRGMAGFTGGQFTSTLFGGQAAGGIAMMQMAVQLSERMMRFVASTADIANNTTMTGAQKERGILESLPVFGGLAKAVREFNEAIEGTTNALRINALAHELNTAMIRTGIASSSQYAAYEFERNQAGSRAAGLANAAPGRLGYGGARSTIAAEREFERASVLNPLMGRESIAGGEAAGARATYLRSQEESKNAEWQVNELLNQRNDAQQRLNQLRAQEEDGVRRKADIDAAAIRVAELNQQLAGKRVMHEQALNREKQAGVAAAQADHALAQARVATMQGELEIIRRREAALTGRARALGTMNPVQRQLGVNALELIQQNGLQSATPEMIQLAQNVAPETMQKMAENFGQNTEEFRRLKKVAPDEFAGDIPKMRQQMADLSTKINAQLVVDTQALSRELAAIQANFLRDIKMELQGKLSDTRAEITSQQLRRNNQTP